MGIETGSSKLRKLSPAAAGRLSGHLTFGWRARALRRFEIGRRDSSAQIADWPAYAKATARQACRSWRAKSCPFSVTKL